MDAIRRSQHAYWLKHGDPPDWERDFYGPVTSLLGAEAPGPGGFLRGWSEVFDWYRAEAQYRVQNMREAYSAAKSAFFAEVERLRGLTEDDVGRALASSRGGALEFFAWLSVQGEPDFPDGVALGVAGLDAARVFWEFEAFAHNVRSILDTLVRLVAPCYPEPVPASISRFSKKTFTDEVAAGLRAAWTGWGRRLAEYRDCVVHYTPVRVEPSVRGWKVAGEWRVEFYLPDNPSVRNIDSFRFQRRVDVLAYSEGALKSLDRLSYRVAELLVRLWRRGLYPRRPGPYFR